MAEPFSDADDIADVGYLLIGRLAYLIGTFLVTMVFNVLRCEMILAKDPCG